MLLVLVPPILSLLRALQRAATSALRVSPLRSERRAIRGLLEVCN